MGEKLNIQEKTKLIMRTTKRIFHNEIYRVILRNRGVQAWIRKHRSRMCLGKRVAGETCINI